jgi:hypothetical protein
MLVWLSQLGLGVAVMPILCILLAVYLRDSLGFGGWVIWVGILLAVYTAVVGLISSLKTMQRLSEPKQNTPGVAFNDHT